VKLLEYHRVRAQEEESWDRERLRAEAGETFTTAAEPLLPVHKLHWAPTQYMQFTREPWFDRCLELCELYRQATDTQRTWLRSRIDHNISGKLGVCGLQTAILGAREHSTDLSRCSLVAFAIRDLADDIRGVLMGLSLLCHCATLAGADVPALLREVAAISGAAIRILFEEWAERYPEVAPIGSMGWKQVDTPDGPGFLLCR
jgi:hypothetical protein